MSKDKVIKIGECPVDSGTIMLVDPCYITPRSDQKGFTEEEYNKNVVDQCEQLVWQGFGKAACFTTSGMGDGVYPVFAKVRDGCVLSVTIQFMEDE